MLTVSSRCKYKHSNAELEMFYVKRFEFIGGVEMVEEVEGVEKLEEVTKVLPIKSTNNQIPESPKQQIH